MLFDIGKYFKIPCVLDNESKSSLKFENAARFLYINIKKISEQHKSEVYYSVSTDNIASNALINYVYPNI